MTLEAPRVSVIITVYQRTAFLAQAIESVLAQSCQDFEIIVVEDGSRAARDVVRRYGDRVRYVWQTQQRVSAARNAGARIARGQWLAFLDDDDYWLPEKLERQLGLADYFPDLGLIHTNYLDVEDGKIQTRRRTFAPAEMPCGWITSSLFLRFVGLPSTVMVRRSVFERAGGFDASVFFSEDYDLWLRVSRICPFGYVAEPLVGHRRHRGSLSDNELAVDAGTLAILERFLAYTPTLFDECGGGAVRKRLQSLHFRCGRLLSWQDDFVAARRHLLRAWRLEPTHIRALTLALVTFLPVPAINMARTVRGGLSGRRVEKPTSRGGS